MVSSRSTEIKPIDAVKNADIIILSVPIESTESVIKEIAPYVKKDSILSDFASVKIMPCKTMKKHSKSAVVGCHPLFGPGVEIKGQKTDQDKAKWQAAKEWVHAVNLNGNFGIWEFKVLDDPKNLFEVVR